MESFLLSDMRVLREINLDKVRSWKPFSKTRQNIGMVSSLLSNKKPEEKGSVSFGESTLSRMDRAGYEVCADGSTRVLRICEYPGTQKKYVALQSSSKYKLVLPSMSVHLLQYGMQVRLSDRNKQFEKYFSLFFLNPGLKIHEND